MCCPSRVIQSSLLLFTLVSYWQQDPCLGWPDFPWASVIATAAALLTNAIEFVAGQFFGAGEGGHDPPLGCGHANGHCGHGHSSTEPLMQVYNGGLPRRGSSQCGGSPH